MDVHDRILKAIRYIEQHLDEPISLKTLAAQSMYAPFHFHHMFTGMMGEGVAEYQRRLKMQRAANALAYGSDAIIDIALEAGYSSQEAFTRAFKKWCHHTPKQYRKHKPEHKFIKGTIPMSATNSITEKFGYKVEIKTFPAINVACVRHTGSYDGCGQAHETLCNWAGENGLFSSPVKSYGITFDDPSVTPENKCRYDACFAVPEDMEITAPAIASAIPAGRYACIIHKGSYFTLSNAYTALLGEWLPQSGEEILNTPPIQRYYAGPDTPEDEQVTEIRIALK